MSTEADPDLVARRVRSRLPGQLVVRVTVGHVEFQEYVLRTHRTEIADQIANKFSRTHPEFSAKAGFTRWQGALGALALFTSAVLLVLAPGVLLVIMAGIFLATTLVKVILSIGSLLPSALPGQRPASARPTKVPDMDAASLPFYTVLVPVYDEAAVMSSLVAGLAKIWYPHDRLEILFLIEEHDTVTKEAALAADMAPYMRIVELPPGAPQTKPRSCNLGLLLARGDLVTVFDAEDRPEPDQLLKAAAAFAADEDGKLACVQARLFFYNAKRNLLTRQYELEYSLRYGMILPGLARLGLPIPLGGTSNHLRTDVLRAVGGWDAWNVTEDADLGMRCRALGYRVDMIDTVTWEEATSTPGAWIRQRTRWLKGFMITVLVHTRSPLRTLRRFKPSGMVTLLGILAASPLMFLTQPVATVLLLLASLGVGWSSLGDGAHISITGTILVVATVLNVGITLVAAMFRRMAYSHLACLLPGYWLLYWVAAWRALGQLIRSPFTWEKTPHGRDTGDDLPHTREAAVS
ncbi:glycosyltransferase family 2 protein [Amycolatopsis sp. EV170708-02-1]|uniref:glycosyltransferase family 2 protein n=1 Tax=Amycolatopsis sp. EV170708-02-1 TaxID=2919322 RepID=UPI001F0BC231|nr:glycosyltransferase [Amycolatopsis sp. EV170708-02-1]UMP06982.1 glycosyltransferase [Amycolatopsis sp. EV170708-02-1]